MQFLSIAQSVVVMHRPMWVLKRSVARLERHRPQRLYQLGVDLGETAGAGRWNPDGFNRVSAGRRRGQVVSCASVGSNADRAPHRVITLAFDGDGVRRQVGDQGHDSEWTGVTSQVSAVRAVAWGFGRGAGA